MGLNVGCLDHGFVKLVDSMGGDLSVVNAARISYNKSSEEFNERDEKLIGFLGEHGHTAPFRHVYMTLHFKAPLFIRAQAIKHMVGADHTFKDVSSNEISMRYTTLGEPEYYIPKSLRSQSASNKQASGEDLDEEAQSGLLAIYQDSIEDALVNYRLLIHSGVAREQARMILPTALYTEWVVTGSLQWAAHFVKLRSAPGAQTEIREFANAVEFIASQIAPTAWAALMKGNVG
jgi:thymidylate synthase (FAD)